MMLGFYLESCDLLKIHYLCGDKDNGGYRMEITQESCDLLKIHYLCGDKDNAGAKKAVSDAVVICSKFITFAVTKTTFAFASICFACCDLLKIHYLCGDKDNKEQNLRNHQLVVICSKFITFAVTKTTLRKMDA